MSTNDPKKREQEQRQNRILDAAESVIGAKGFDNATMDEIAAEAELSKGTLYLYFSNKADLYLAINKRGLEILLDKFQKVLKEDRPGIELIHQLGEAYISFVTTHPEYTKALIHYESFINEETREAYPYAKECEEIGRQLLMYLTRTLQVGMHDGSISHQMDAQLLGVQIWASMRGMMQLYQMRSQKHVQKVMDNFELDMKSMISQFLEVLLKGIEAKGNSHN